MAIGQIPVQDIWLLREGGENGNADVVVYVQMHGVWYEAIRERADASFSHNITAHGLVSESCKPARWLNEGQSSLSEQAILPAGTELTPGRTLARDLPIIIQRD